MDFKMVTIPEPTKVKLELMSNELNAIIEELERAPHNIYQFMNYGDIIKKLNKGLKDREKKIIKRRKTTSRTIRRS